MRSLVMVAAISLSLGVSAPAHADPGGFGIGFFLGDPTGLDFKVNLQRRSALDILIGLYDFRDRGADYAHITYLVTPAVGHGQSVLIPFRIGIGGAVYGTSDDINLGVRVPIELGFQFRRTGLELYGELALLLTLLDDHDAFDRLELQGGVGLRFYF